MEERLAGLLVITYDFKDQTADDREILFRLPTAGIVGYDVISAHMTLHAGTTANTDNYLTLTLQDAGADGTGTAVIASRGGKSVLWDADGVYDFTMAGGIPYAITAGDWIALDSNETGTWAAVGTGTVVVSPGQRGAA